MNKRELKAYTRIDGSGRVVAGSLILRKTKPKTGTWQEVQGYECCNSITISAPIIQNGDILRIGFKLLCKNNPINTYSIEHSSSNPAELITILNSIYGMLGVFAVVEDNITWTLSTSQKKYIVSFREAVF